MNKLIEKAKTIYWYQGLLKRNDFGTAYQLEKFYEPESFHIEDKRTIYKNKWVNYRDGKHVPNKRLVQKVEHKSPGSENDIRHVFWEILLINPSEVIDYNYWVRRLAPDVQSLLCYKIKNKGDAFLVRKEYGSQLRASLLGNTSLDSLSALLLFWIESKKLGDSHLNPKLAYDVYDTLLMMGVYLKGRRVIDILYKILTETVIAQTLWHQQQYIGNFEYFTRSYQVLYSLLWKIEDWHVSDPLEKTNRLMYKLLGGDYGFDVRFALKPIFVGDWIYGPPPKNEFNKGHHSYKEWLWGWLHINNQSMGRVINDELWQEIEDMTQLPDRDDFIKNKILRASCLLPT